MVNGFILTAITNKGRHGIIECKKANLKKETLSKDPLSIKFLFTNFQMKHIVKKEDVEFYLRHMIGFIGVRDIDYKLEVI